MIHRMTSVLELSDWELLYFAVAIAGLCGVEFDGPY